MTLSSTDRGPHGGGQTLVGAQAWLHEHLRQRRHPMNLIEPAAAARTIDDLPGIDGAAWSAAWLATAAEFADTAQRATADGEARDAWWQAYLFAFLGRYPVPDHPAKIEAYRLAREYFLRATALDDPPVERIEVPFRGHPGEGDRVVVYLARPRGVRRPPVVISWAGIDSWKEESLVGSKHFWDRGIATIHVDMPGTGESPILAGVDAERAWDPVFGWLADSDLDAGRVAVLGASFGGYWATKLAHTHRDRLAAAVNWAGGIHRTFQRPWQEQSRGASSYLMNLMGARARPFGGTTFEEYVTRCPELSLLDQGVLDQPSCPLLLVNGKDDRQNDPADIVLALEHGDPKTARLYPGGHMGADMRAIRIVIADWVEDQLVNSRGRTVA